MGAGEIPESNRYHPHPPVNIDKGHTEAEEMIPNLSLPHIKHCSWSEVKELDMVSNEGPLLAFALKAHLA